MFIYIELSQIYKRYSIIAILIAILFKTRERKFRVNHHLHETPRCNLDAALPVVENLQKYRYILENIDGIFIDFS